MSKLKTQRYEIVKKMMISNGIEFEKILLISIWDIAFNINNCWHAPTFVNIKKFKESSLHIWGNQVVALKNGEYHLFRAIRHAIKNTDIQLRVSGNGVEFLMYPPKEKK